MTLDGSELDLLTMTTSCDLTPLVVCQQGLPEELAGGIQDDAEECAGQLDTLHSVLVSTGFYLD